MKSGPTLALRALGPLVLFSCVTHFEPPAELDEPVSVFVARDSWHCGLRLPLPSGDYVEYGFGDWAWFAERRESAIRLFPTMLLPTAGAVCRSVIVRDLAATPSDRRSDGEVFGFLVERERAVSLRVELEDRWFAEPGAYLFDPGRDLDFRESGWNYSMAWNCYDAVAHWLRDLGCRVPSTLVRTGLRPDDPGR